MSFYTAASQKAQKYLKPPLTSWLLQYCDILDPKVFFSTEVDVLKKQLKYLATKFTNVIKQEKVPEMLDMVASLRANERLKELVSVVSPTGFFGRLFGYQD